MFNLPISPEQASEFAPRYDELYWMTVVLTIFFTLVVGIGMVVLAIRYRKGTKVNRHNPADTHMGLEITWSVIPLVLGLVMFFWAAALFVQQRTPPKDAMDFFVVGKQWMWHVQHPSGVRENFNLHVPINKPIRLTMISQDVIHSFFIPQFRMKQDVIPGRFTTQWFKATKIGKYNIFCAEYCGTQHSEMGGYVYVLSQADYQRWVEAGGEDAALNRLTPTQEGKILYDRLACGNCHTETNTERGPTLFGIYGTNRKLKDGSTSVADVNYLRQEILNPHDRLTAGYSDTMPVYKNDLTEVQILHLISYIRSLGSAAPLTVASNTGAAGRPADSGGR